MKRTLLAVGIAILVSMMAVPRRLLHSSNVVDSWLPLFSDGEIMWEMFILQTIFLAVLLAVIVNLFPRRK